MKRKEKQFVVNEIKRLIKETDNIRLLNLIYLVLLKADKIDLTADLCSDGTPDTSRINS